MDKSKGKEILGEVLCNVSAWKPVESFKDKAGNEYPVIFFNLFFKESKACILRFKVDKTKFDIYVTPLDNNTLDFGVKCGSDDAWFSSTNIRECINFAENWFAEYKEQK